MTEKNNTYAGMLNFYNAERSRPQVINSETVNS